MRRLIGSSIPQLSLKKLLKKNGIERECPMNQRDFMRQLYQEFGDHEDILVREYAAGEERGIVTRQSNTHDLTPEQYARALYRDGIHKGWIEEPPLGI
jgi:hypothetical protein